MQINENQQAVPKNLRNTLDADLLYDSADRREQIKVFQAATSPSALAKTRRRRLTGAF